MSCVLSPGDYKKKANPPAEIAFFICNHPEVLLPEVESFDYSSVSFDIILLEVLEKRPAFTDEAQKRPLRAEIMTILLEVFRKVVDTIGEQRYLALGRAGIGVGRPVLAKKLLLFFCC